MARRSVAEEFSRQYKILEAIESEKEAAVDYAIGEDASRETIAEIKDKYLKRKQTQEITLIQLASEITLEPGEWREYATCYAASYMITGQGEKYAKVQAVYRFCIVDYCGVPGCVELEAGKERPYLTDLWAYTVWVSVKDDFNFKVLRYKMPFAYADEVRFQLASGVNPRVYNPFLEPSYERKAGFDVFGRVTDQARFDAACEVEPRLPKSVHQIWAKAQNFRRTALRQPGLS